MNKPVRNRYCHRGDDWVVPGKCACCERCWIYVSPPHRAGLCVFNGPFEGYKREDHGVLINAPDPR